MSVRIKNLKQFNASINKVMKNVEKGSSKVLAKISIDTFENLKTKTPKETRRAAGGWTFNVNTPPSEWKPPEGSDYYQLQPVRNINTIKHNSKINLSNNVEYIIPLDEGHSKQAQAGIIDPVLSRTTAFLNKLARAESKRKIK